MDGGLHGPLEGPEHEAGHAQNTNTIVFTNSNNDNNHEHDLMSFVVWNSLSHGLDVLVFGGV